MSLTTGFPNDAPNNPGTNQRRQSRLEIRLPARVCGRESAGCAWAGLTHLTNVTQLGARFMLQRPLETGRVVQIISSLPDQLRCFDFQEAQYRVWALVTNVRYLEDAPGGAMVEAGVAFTGARAPAEYEAQPQQLYEIATPPDGTALWQIRPLRQTPTAPEAGETRHPIALPVEIQTFAGRNVKSVQETTVTENLSRRAATVFTNSAIETGRFVRVTSAEQQVSLLAAVRSRSTGADGRIRLSVEFISGAWPLKGVE